MYENISEAIQEVSQSAQPSRSPKEGEMRNKQWQNKCDIWNHRRTDKGELRRKNRLGKVSRKTTAGGGGVGLKPALFAWNLTLNSNAVLNYKYLFFYPHRSPLLLPRGWEWGPPPSCPKEPEKLISLNLNRNFTALSNGGVERLLKSLHQTMKMFNP